MKLSSERIISSGQLFGLLFVYKLFTILLYPSAINSTGSFQEIIISLLIFSVISFLLLYSVIQYRKLSTDSEIWLINGGYGLFFSFLFLFHINDLYSFISELTGNSFNTMLCIIFLLIFSIYSATRGVEAIVRFSSVVVIFSLLLSVLFVVCLIPSFSIDKVGLGGTFSISYNSRGIITLFSQAQEIALMFILCKKAKGNFFRDCMLWNIFQYIFLIMIFILVFGSLGNYLIGIKYPLFHSIEGSGVLQRLNAVFLSAVTSLGFTAVTTDLYIINETSRHFKFRVSSLLIPAGLSLAAVFCCLNPDFSELIFQQSVVFYGTLIFSVIIPFAAIVFLKLKSVSKKTAAASVLFICIITVAIFSGCSAAQLNQRIIIQGMGIDKTENGYELTLLVLDTESDSVKNHEKLMKSDGPTVREAIHALERNSGMKTMLSQCLFIIMNTDAAKEYTETLSYFSEQNDIMKLTGLMTAQDSSALIEIAVDEMGYNSERLELLTDSKVIENSIPSFTLFDYVSVIKASDKDLVFPYIEIDKKNDSIAVKGSYTVRTD